MENDSVPATWPGKFNWLVGVGLALAALALYVSTLAPTVLEADAGEFQFVPWLPGIAHPTGYPLYVLLGWLWTHLLPVGTVAWRMNLLSAVLAAAAVGVTYAVARRLLGRALPTSPKPAQTIVAAATAATFAVTRTFWSQAIIAEVYALHALFVAGIVWLALKATGSGSTRPRWSGKLLALAVGLGLTHHVTTILLVPALLLFLWQTPRPQTGPRRWFKVAATYGLLAVAPLLLYLYLPLAAPTTPYATLHLSDTQPLTLYDNSVQGFWEHVTGTVFTGELRPAAVGWERLLLAWQLLRQQVGWVGVVLALVGLGTLWQQRRTNLLLLTGGGFLAFVGFNLIYFIGDVFVLFIPAWFFICIWLGVGSLGLAHWLAGQFVRSKADLNQYVIFDRMRNRLQQRAYQVVGSTLALFFFALPGVLVVTQIAQVDQSGNVAAGERWQQILAEPIPNAAILISNDRNEMMPMWYYQYVENRRPDLLGLFPLIVPQPAYANVGRVLNQALASGRPVYLIKPMDGLKVKAHIVPEGTLFRANAYSAAPAHPVNMSLPAVTVSTPAGETFEETVTLLGYDISPAKARPGQDVTIMLHWQAPHPLKINYTSYVHLLADDGQRISQNDHRPGTHFYPTGYWQPNEILRDRHTLSIPKDALPGTYKLRAGMYYQPEPGVVSGMGSGIEIGTITINGAL